VREYYAGLFRAAPDLHIEVKSRHVSADAIVLEVLITGTHLGSWRGLPATGRHLEFPLCAVFTFDENDRMLASGSTTTAPRCCASSASCPSPPPWAAASGWRFSIRSPWSRGHPLGVPALIGSTA